MENQVTRDKLEKLLKGYMGYQYSIQYIYYNDTDWTLPVMLKQYRLESLLHDKSISKVKILDYPNDYIFEITD